LLIEERGDRIIHPASHGWQQRLTKVVVGPQTDECNGV